MNRLTPCVLSLLISVAFAFSAAAQQQPPTVASLVAERQQMEERYKQLRAAYEDLVDALELQRRQLEEVRAEVNELKRAPKVDDSKFATKGDLSRIENAMKDLNDSWNAKRDEDRKLIVEQLKQLKNATEASSRTQPITPSSTAKDYSTYFEYEIKPGDTLLAVIRGYNDSGIPVTLDQVKRFNPGIKADKLQVGDIVKIPDPR